MVIGSSSASINKIDFNREQIYFFIIWLVAVSVLLCCDRHYLFQSYNNVRINFFFILSNKIKKGITVQTN